METLKIEFANEQEKKVLLAFLDSLGYQYVIDIEDDRVFTDEHAQEIARRQADLLSGRTSSLPWSETRKRPEDV